MNNRLKVALGLAIGGALVLVSLKRKKTKQAIRYVAPDGNSYKENQLYRTYDNKLYKNGKQLHIKTPELEQTSIHSANNLIDTSNKAISKDHQIPNKNINYHQKGVRHH